MYAWNYAKMNGFGVMYDDHEVSGFGQTPAPSEWQCGEQGQQYDAATDSCISAGTPPAPPKSGGSTSSPTSPTGAPTTAGLGGSTVLYVLGGLAVIGLIYEAAKHSKKKRH